MSNLHFSYRKEALGRSHLYLGSRTVLLHIPTTQVDVGQHWDRTVFGHDYFCRASLVLFCVCPTSDQQTPPPITMCSLLNMLCTQEKCQWIDLLCLEGS